MDATPPFRADGNDRPSTPPYTRPEGGRITEDESASEPGGYGCPICGDLLQERRDGGEPAFQCRIGHPFEALELWVAHCTARNATLEIAARALAENATLARGLATWSRERGNPAAADRIAEEAQFEERCYAQVQRMLGGLEPGDPTGAPPDR